MIFNHTENRTVDACAPTVFSFVGSEKPGRFSFVKPFLPCKLKAAQPAFDPLGQLVSRLLAAGKRG